MRSRIDCYNWQDPAMSAEPHELSTPVYFRWSPNSQVTFQEAQRPLVDWDEETTREVKNQHTILMKPRLSKIPTRNFKSSIKNKTNFFSLYNKYTRNLLPNSGQSLFYRMVLKLCSCGVDKKKAHQSFRKRHSEWRIEFQDNWQPLIFYEFWRNESFHWRAGGSLWSLYEI